MLKFDRTFISDERYEFPVSISIGKEKKFEQLVNNFAESFRAFKDMEPDLHQISKHIYADDYKLKCYVFGNKRDHMVFYKDLVSIVCYSCTLIYIVISDDDHTNFAEYDVSDLLEEGICYE